MLAILVRYTLQNLRARPGRTLLTTGGIVLGVGVVLAIQITNESTLASVERVLEEASGKAHLQIESAALSGEGFSQELLRDVERVPGVRFAVPSLTVPTLLAEEAERWEPSFVLGGGYSPNVLELFGIDPALDSQARVYRMLEGNFLSPGDERHVLVLTETYAQDKGIQLGEVIELLTPQGVEAFRVDGLMAAEGLGATNGGAVAVAPLAVVQDVFDRGGRLDRIDVVAEASVAQDETQLERLRRILEQSLGPEFEVLYPAARGRLFAQMLSSYQQGLAFFSAIAFFVGAFLIYNTFSMTVTERTREIGLLRSMGATRRQILGLVFFEASLLGAWGSTLGVLAGVALSRGMMLSVSALLGVQLAEARLPPTGVAQALGIGLGITLLSALLPAQRASRISPLRALAARAQAGSSWLLDRGWILGLALVAVGWLLLYPIPVRPSAVVPVGGFSTIAVFLGAALLVPGVVDRLEALFRAVFIRVYGQEGRLGAANVRRERGRTALTVAALMVGAAMVVDIGALTGSFRADIQDWVARALGGDLYVRSPLAMRPELGARIATLPGVEAITPLTYVLARTAGAAGEETGGDQLLFVAVEPSSHSQVTGFQFAIRPDDERMLRDQLARGDSVLISTVVAERYRLAIGDTLPLATRRGPRLFTVAGIIVDFTFQGRAVTGTRDDLRRYFGTREVNVFVLRAAPGASPRQLADLIEDRFGDRYHLQIQLNQEFQARVQGLVNESFALFHVLSLIAIVVGGLGVANTLLMNILERVREIGVLRSLGMTRRQVAKMVLAEAGLMGVMGALWGMVCGAFLSLAFVRGLNQMAGYRLGYVFPWADLLTSLLIIVGASQLAALFPSRQAAALNIVQAIQHE